MIIIINKNYKNKNNDDIDFLYIPIIDLTGNNGRYDGENYDYTFMDFIGPELLNQENNSINDDAKIYQKYTVKNGIPNLIGFDLRLPKMDSIYLFSKEHASEDLRMYDKINNISGIIPGLTETRYSGPHIVPSITIDTSNNKGYLNTRDGNIAECQKNQVIFLEYYTRNTAKSLLDNNIINKKDYNGLPNIVSLYESQRLNKNVIQSHLAYDTQFYNSLDNLYYTKNTSKYKKLSLGGYELKKHVEYMNYKYSLMKDNILKFNNIRLPDPQNIDEVRAFNDKIYDQIINDKTFKMDIFMDSIPMEKDRIKFMREEIKNEMNKITPFDNIGKKYELTERLNRLNDEEKYYSLTSSWYKDFIPYINKINTENKNLSILTENEFNKLNTISIGNLKDIQNLVLSYKEKIDEQMGQVNQVVNSEKLTKIFVYEKIVKNLSEIEKICPDKLNQIYDNKFYAEQANDLIITNKNLDRISKIVKEDIALNSINLKNINSINDINNTIKDLEKIKKDRLYQIKGINNINSQETKENRQIIRNIMGNINGDLLIDKENTSKSISDYIKKYPNNIYNKQLDELNGDIISDSVINKSTIQNLRKVKDEEISNILNNIEELNAKMEHTDENIINRIKDLNEQSHLFDDIIEESNDVGLELSPNLIAKINSNDFNSLTTKETLELLDAVKTVKIDYYDFNLITEKIMNDNNPSYQLKEQIDKITNVKYIQDTPFENILNNINKNIISENKIDDKQIELLKKEINSEHLTGNLSKNVSDMIKLTEIYNNEIDSRRLDPESIKLIQHLNSKYHFIDNLQEDINQNQLKFSPELMKKIEFNQVDLINSLSRKQAGELLSEVQSIRYHYLNYDKLIDYIANKDAPQNFYNHQGLEQIKKDFLEEDEDHMYFSKLNNDDKYIVKNAMNFDAKVNYVIHELNLIKKENIYDISNNTYNLFVKNDEKSKIFKCIINNTKDLSNIYYNEDIPETERLNNLMSYLSQKLNITKNNIQNIKPYLLSSEFKNIIDYDGKIKESGIIDYLNKDSVEFLKNPESCNKMLQVLTDITDKKISLNVNDMQYVQKQKDYPLGAIANVWKKELENHIEENKIRLFKEKQKTITNFNQLLDKTSNIKDTQEQYKNVLKENNHINEKTFSLLKDQLNNKQINFFVNNSDKYKDIVKNSIGDIIENTKINERTEKSNLKKLYSKLENNEINTYELATILSSDNTSKIHLKQQTINNIYDKIKQDVSHLSNEYKENHDNFKIINNDDTLNYINHARNNDKDILSCKKDLEKQLIDVKNVIENAKKSNISLFSDNKLNADIKINDNYLSNIIYDKYERTTFLNELQRSIDINKYGQNNYILNYYQKMYNLWTQKLDHDNNEMQDQMVKAVNLGDIHNIKYDKDNHPYTKKQIEKIFDPRIENDREQLLKYEKLYNKAINNKQNTLNKKIENETQLIKNINNFIKESDLSYVDGENFQKHVVLYGIDISNSMNVKYGMETALNNFVDYAQGKRENIPSYKDTKSYIELLSLLGKEQLSENEMLSNPEKIQNFYKLKEHQIEISELITDLKELEVYQNNNEICKLFYGDKTQFDVNTLSNNDLKNLYSDLYSMPIKNYNPKLDDGFYIQNQVDEINDKKQAFNKEAYKIKDLNNLSDIDISKMKGYVQYVQDEIKNGNNDVIDNVQNLMTDANTSTESIINKWLNNDYTNGIIDNLNNLTSSEVQSVVDKVYGINLNIKNDKTNNVFENIAEYRECKRSYESLQNQIVRISVLEQQQDNNVNLNDEYLKLRQLCKIHDENVNGFNEISKDNAEIKINDMNLKQAVISAMESDQINKCSEIFTDSTNKIDNFVNPDFIQKDNIVDNVELSLPLNEKINEAYMKEYNDIKDKMFCLSKETNEVKQSIESRINEKYDILSQKSNSEDIEKQDVQYVQDVQNVQDDSINQEEQEMLQI